MKNQSIAAVRLVELKESCSACVIIGGLLRDVLGKLEKEYPQLEIEYLELENLRTVHEIEGLEVEKFPAVIIGEEQVTAGSLLSKQQIVQMLQHGGYI